MDPQLDRPPVRAVEHQAAGAERATQMRQGETGQQKQALAPMLICFETRPGEGEELDRKRHRRTRRRRPLGRGLMNLYCSDQDQAMESEM